RIAGHLLLAVLSCLVQQIHCLGAIHRRLNVVCRTCRITLQDQIEYGRIVRPEHSRILSRDNETPWRIRRRLACDSECEVEHGLLVATCTRRPVLPET